MQCKSSFTLKYSFFLTYLTEEPDSKGSAPVPTSNLLVEEQNDPRKIKKSKDIEWILSGLEKNTTGQTSKSIEEKNKELQNSLESMQEKPNGGSNRMSGNSDFNFYYSPLHQDFRLVSFLGSNIILTESFNVTTNFFFNKIFYRVLQILS